MIKLTRKQAIQWAHDACLINKEGYSVEHMGALADDIQRFARVAYEAGQKDEREACAAMLDQMAEEAEQDCEPISLVEYYHEKAAAIRARGNPWALRQKSK